MTSIAQILLLILNIAWWIIIVQAVMSWLINFDVINLRQRFVYTIWSSLNRMTEPLYAPIRQFIPPMGGLDIAPLILLIAIFALRIVIANNLLYA